MNIEKVKVRDVAERIGASEKLVRAVVRQLGGRESLEDVARHGASGGFGGFVYYTDTVAFFRRNRADVVKLAENMAESLGENVAEMVAGFNCLGGCDEKRRFMPDVCRALYGGGKLEDDLVPNALAWFALEEVARGFVDCAEDMRHA